MIPPKLFHNPCPDAAHEFVPAPEAFPRWVTHACTKCSQLWPRATSTQIASLIEPISAYRSQPRIGLIHGGLS